MTWQGALRDDSEERRLADDTPGAYDVGSSVAITSRTSATRVEHEEPTRLDRSQIQMTTEWSVLRSPQD